MASELKKTALYDLHVGLGAKIVEFGGWDMPLSYETGTVAEHRACREGVVLIDMSFMSKFLVQGRDAGACINRLCTANVDGPKGLLALRSIYSVASVALLITNPNIC